MLVAISTVAPDGHVTRVVAGFGTVVVGVGAVVVVVGLVGAFGAVGTGWQAAMKTAASDSASTAHLGP
ncbi:MAG TPA: hypothetical protein VHK88_16980 [Aquihabitans sp.]|jgi:hypothetical protein|nr:hypothetical protein [Aquihabitans sp.]